MRIDKSEISSSPYSVERVKDFLFKSFMNEAAEILLFLNHIQEISMYDKTDDTLLYRISIHPDQKRVVTSERNALIKTAQSIPLHPYLRIYSMSISIESFCEQNQSFHWLIVNMIGFLKDLDNFQTSLKLVPWVGVATALPNKCELRNICMHEIDISKIVSKLPTSIKVSASISAASTKGLAFCFLPLSLPTHLPIHIHGCFALTDNRNCICWPSAKGNKSDMPAIWNQKLVCEFIIPIYRILIACRSKLITYKKSISSLDAYAAWPVWAAVKNEEIWRELVEPTIHGIVLEQKVFWSITTNKWVSRREAIFLPPATDSENLIPECVVDLMTKTDAFPVIRLPDEIWQTLKKLQLLQHVCATKVSPTHVRQAFKRARMKFDSIESFYLFLEYLMQDIRMVQGKIKNLDDLLGLKIIPLATKGLALKPAMASGDDEDIIYFLTEDMTDILHLLPGLETSLVSISKSKYPSIYQKFHDFAKSKQLQIRLITQDIFCQRLLLQSIKTWSAFKPNHPLDWNMKSSKCPEFQWIKKVWDWLKKDPSIVLKTVGIPILPKEVINEDTLTCTLLPMPSSSNKYFCTEENDTPLVKILQKLDANVIEKNDFVFYNGKLSKCILTPTIPNVLHYFKGKEAKVSCLDNSDKDMLLSLISSHYYRANTLDSFTCTCIRELPIFPVGITVTQLKFLPLNPPDNILPPMSMYFIEDLQYPSNVINIQNRKDVFNLLTELLKYKVTPIDELYIVILKYAIDQLKESSCINNGDKLIIWILKMYHNLSKKVVRFLESEKCVRTSQNSKALKKPEELFDPENKKFQDLFDAETEETFPHNYYVQEGVMDVLIKLGLIDWPKLVSDNRLFCNFLLERAEKVKKMPKMGISMGKHILETIADHPKQCSVLMHAVESVRFLKAEDSKPHNFPSCLPWFGEEKKTLLVSPKSLCYDENVAKLIGSVLPIIHREYRFVKLPDMATKRFLIPEVKNVLQQLEILVKIASNFDKNDTHIVSEIVCGIYMFLDEHASTLQSAVYALPKEWIWWNHKGKYCFLSSDCFVRESKIDLEPYLYCIKTSGTFNYPKLLQKSGIRPHPTPEQLVEVLKSISVPLNAHDTKISISILCHLHELQYMTGSDLLVPTVDEQLLPVKQCTFDDREWVKEKNVCDFPGIYFVHRDIPASHAEYFGVQPLSLQVAPSKELEIKYCQFGQSEPLTQRLHGIVNDYCGKIDVFKELLQNADDAKASKVVFLLDWRQHGTTSLFNDKMKFWQGPALIAYNNSTFSDEDLQNICKLAGESKKIDPYKTGQYGLGFCSCYTLTDVPSFISRCFLTIFDPHTHFLGKRVSQVNRGMQINLFTEKEGLSIYKDQLAPYDNLFRFNLDDMDANGFNGTLFRFPLRMSECPRSKISNDYFDKKRMSKRVKALKKEIQTLLLFLKHVQSLEFFELQENESKMQLLFKVLKKDTDSKRVHLLQTYLSKKSYSPICCDCKILTEVPGEGSLELNYLIASAVVGDSIQQNMIPFAEVAVEMKDGIPINSKEGKQIFCFLPLPLKVQLPFYINGYFEVQKDRQGLKEPHDSNHQSWNARMMESVIPTVIEYLLKTLTEKSLEFSSKSEFLKNFYSLWCVEAVEVSSLVDVLKNSIHCMLKQSDKSLLWSEVGGGMWVPVSEACLFDDYGNSLPPSIASSAIEVLISLGHHIIKCPDNIRRLITESDPAKRRVFDYSSLQETLLMNILKISESDYILHLNHIIQNVSSNNSHNILLKLKEGMQDTPLNDNLINFVVAVSAQFMNKEKLDSSSNIFLPDSENILQEATTLFCNSSLEDTKFEKMSLRFVHESISREVALCCGVQSVRDEILKCNEDTDFLKETTFSEHPNLVGELNKILKETQYSESLLTEFIKLAENAEVNKTAFILDNRTDHPDKFLLSESDEWKNLQHTPALCIFYDKCFDKKRFEDFCTVNREHSCATGQFNMAYHLTDCPMLVSFDNSSSPVQFCVLDPLQKYCARPNSNIPGQRWFGKMLLNQFQDQFKPFLLDKFKEMKKYSSCFSGLSNGFTVIRLPIYHFKSKKENWLNQGKIRDSLQVNECITRFNDTQGNALLFLKHLSCLSIFEIEEVGKLIHHLSLTSTKQIVSDQSTFKVELSSSKRDKPSLWLVNEHIALLSQKKSIPGMEKGSLNCCGNTAIELECSSKSMKGSLFCMLSVNIDTSLPVHMNADFLLDSSKHQVSLADHPQNKYIFEHILIHSYIKLLDQAREYVNVDEEDIIQWYYSLFLQTLEISRTLHVLPVIRDLWKSFYTILVKNDSLILLSQSRWLQVSKGMFFLHTNEHSVCQTLCSLGMPITCAPRFVYDNICKVYQPYQNQNTVTSQTMCSYLKSIKRFSEENLALIANQCEYLLEFFLQGMKEQDVCRMLTGVPLLLTLKNTLSRSGSLYDSEFVQLLPKSLHDKFIHPKLEYSELIGHKLKQLKIVTVLPVDVVAENMLLEDTDKKAVNLDSEETEFVRVLWTYLEKNTNHVKAFSELFYKKPIVPSSSGFVPLCLSKNVFVNNRDCVLLKKLGYPILDVSKLRFSKPPEVMVSLISNTIGNPQDIISSMQLSPPTNVREFTRNEVDRLVLLLSDCDIPPSILKDLPLFQTVDNQYHCLSEARHHVIVDILPNTAGLKAIQDISRTLIFRSPNELLNKVLGSKLRRLTDIKVYTQLILPYVEVCTDDEIWEHLTVVKNWIYNPKCEETFKTEIVEIIKDQKIICKNGQRYSVSELYDPDVSFHTEFNKAMLAPDNCTGEWLSFLRLLGLQSEIATHSWCHMAIQVASDGSSLSHHRTVQNDTTRKSDVLLECLHKIVAKEMKREKDHAEFLQFLTTIAEIKFIYNRNGNQLCKCLSTITDRDHEKNCKSFICFKGAVIVDNGQRVHLLKADVLPQSCEFIVNCSAVVQHSLSIQKLSNSMIVENLIALSKSLYNVNNQAFVPSNTKKSAIEKVKETFELYYRFLNNQSDLEQNVSQDMSSVRCIFICPNEFSFQLLQPSQVVMKMFNDAADLKPFCYPIPQNLQVYSNLWHALGIKDEVDSLMCLQILSNIKEEMEQSGMMKFQENDPFWNVCISAYNRLILLSHGTVEKFHKDLKILLPSDDRFLLQNSELVFSDVPRIEKMLKQWSGFNLKFLFPPQPNQLGEIILPPALNVKLVSDITYEELHPDIFSRLNQCTEQELFESQKRKFNCETTEKISGILKSEECQSGLARLYWHEQKKNPSFDTLFQNKLQELEDLIVLCRRNIKTAIKFKNRTIPNTENSNYHCYLSKRDNKLQLFIVHNPFPDVAFWGQLATCLSKHFNKSISASSSLISILACHTPDDIPLRLDELEISKLDKNVSTPEDVDIGEEIPFKDLFNQTEQDLLIFCNFDSGEKVLYHGVQNNLPVCKVARIISCPVVNSVNLNERLVRLQTDKSTAIDVSLLQICKILNASQRQKLLHNEISTTKFFEPLILAQLPEDLESWISETFRHNSTRFCCSTIQLAKRILSHIHYSLTEKEEDISVFLARAKYALDCIRNERDKIAVIKFVKSLKNVPNFLNQPATQMVPMGGVAQAHPSFLYTSMYNVWSQPQPVFEPPSLMLPSLMLPSLMRPEPKLEQKVKMHREHRPRYKLVLIDHSVRESHPDEIVAKAWLQQAKADYMAALDTLSQLTTDDDAGEIGEEELSMANKSICKYPALVCFLCHDVLEKCIKGIMYIRMGVPSNLLHCKNLYTLLSAVEMKDSTAYQQDKLIQAVQSCVASISVHGNRSRYPNYHYPPFSPAAVYGQIEAAECLKSIKTLMDHLLQDENISGLLGSMDEIGYDRFKTALSSIGNKGIT